jgi:hypothetical protein
MTKNAMTCQQFEELIPRLLDGDVEMSADMRAHDACAPEARAHMAGCASCRSLLADLKTIQAGAATLPALEPQRDLWSGIAARIEAPVVPMGGAGVSRLGQRQLSWRVASIAAAILVVTTTTITYEMTRRIQPTPVLIGGVPGETTPPVAVAVQTPADRQQPPAREAAPNRPLTANVEVAAARNPTPVRTSPSPSRVVLINNAGAKVDYDREVIRLRAILDSGRARLDPATVALLERNLRIIDSAIVQCQNALARDPASNFLIESLNHAYESKVKLLHIAAVASTE